VVVGLAAQPRITEAGNQATRLGATFGNAMQKFIVAVDVMNVLSLPLLKEKMKVFLRK
jgi:hypothetical protein